MSKIFEGYFPYSVYFAGHYPVGAVAIVVAEDKYDAKNMMEEHLKTIGLQQDIAIENISLLNTYSKGVEILLDGNY